jgi:hypothetical protein
MKVELNHTRPREGPRNSLPRVYWRLRIAQVYNNLETALGYAHLSLIRPLRWEVAEMVARFAVEKRHRIPFARGGMDRALSLGGLLYIQRDTPAPCGERWMRAVFVRVPPRIFPHQSEGGRLGGMPEVCPL